MELMMTPLQAGVLVVVVTTLVLVLLRRKKVTKKFLDKSRQTVRLKEVEQLSPDTKRLRFALPSEDMVLGLPVGKHFKVFCPNAKGVATGEWNGRPDPEAEEDEIERKYTPISSDDDRGYVDLVIKVYKGGLVDRFPDGGKMSQHVDKLKVGDALAISGPWGVVQYAGRGKWLYGRKEIPKIANVAMMAGGTGITPMLQIISAILKDPEDSTKLSLLFANQTEADILVRDHLEALQKKHPDRFTTLWYTLDRPPKNWTYSSGFVDADVIKAKLPPPGDSTLVLMCGPPPMIQYACKANLDKLGYPKHRQLAFDFGGTLNSEGRKECKQPEEIQDAKKE
eukprot:CAMPEP_0118902616 /NCGR_PEP_ID=MMETSP1166-20130328/7822_1 /TAXON_ID=1104430 /ORGANISM="Chrysoreinhardia sp, Strain CCMP3193" /LENGTH=337 /DNA_ID=CAMNT_0006841827 /DNA_START=41 /DNA_END=1055 /DNA_ORIENTATION=+